MKVETRLRISAIVCAYNEERSLAAALHSLFAQTRVPDEVIVVNNASTDGTRAVAKAALRENVNIAITLYRGESWTASRATI